jgi:hypothetical protein
MYCISRFTWSSATAAIVALLLCGCGRQLSLGPAADPGDVETYRAALTSGANVATVVASVTYDGFATLRGTIALAGAAPARQVVIVSKDAAVCAPGGREVLSQQLLVNSQNGGIENVVVYLKTQKGAIVPIHDSAKTPGDRKVFLDQKSCVFIPHLLAVHTGQGTLPIKNSDPVGHNAAIATNNINSRRFDQMIAAGGEAALVLKPGMEEVVPAPVTCTVHGWMRSYYFPRDNGYFAVTDKDGKFEIPNLPAGGKIMIQVWHEAAKKGNGGTPAKITYSGGEAKPATQGFEITLPKDKTVEVKCQVPVEAFGK